MSLQLQCSDKIIVRPLRLTDASDLFEYMKDPRVAPHAGGLVDTSIFATISNIQQCLQEPNLSTRLNNGSIFINPYTNSSNLPVFAIVHKETQKMIGTISITENFSSLFDWNTIYSQLYPAYQNNVLFPEIIQSISNSITMNDDKFEATIETLMSRSWGLLPIFSNFNTQHIQPDILDFYDKNYTPQQTSHLNMAILANSPPPFLSSLPLPQLPSESPERRSTLPYWINALEIGYTLHPDFWGNGFTFEAVSSLLENYIWTLPYRPDIVIMSTFAYNQQSIRVIEKLGGKKISTSNNSVCRPSDSTWHDTITYGFIPPTHPCSISVQLSKQTIESKCAPESPNNVTPVDHAATDQNSPCIICPSPINL